MVRGGSPNRSQTSDALARRPAVPGDRGDRPRALFPAALMVRLNRIYTRTGDDGTTGLGDGQRRQKFDARVSAYGEVDELNCLDRPRAPRDAARAIPTSLASTRPWRGRRTTCSISARTSAFRPGDGETAREALRVAPARSSSWSAKSTRSTRICRRCARSCCRAGNAAAAALHQARAVCRRAERASSRSPRATARRWARRPRLHQPAFRLSVRRGALCQSARRGRRPLGSRRASRRPMSPNAEKPHHDVLSVSNPPLFPRCRSSATSDAIPSRAFSASGATTRITRARWATWSIAKSRSISPRARRRCGRAATTIPYPPGTTNYHFEFELVVALGAPAFRDRRRRRARAPSTATPAAST